MLSALRTSLAGQSSQAICRRRMATIAPTLVQSKPTISSQSKHTTRKATGPIKPVYLTLSSFTAKSNSAKKAVALDPTVFDHPIRRDILHLCVVHHLDSLRQGTASTKTRAEVAGSRRKIRPQKGSGRARLGDRQSPMLRGGGVAFGPKPRDFSTKLNRKVIQMGMRVALTMKLREQRLGVLQRINWWSHKTATLSSRLAGLGWRTGTLFVTGESEVPARMRLASRNLRGIECKTVADLVVYDIVKWRRVVLDLAAVDTLERALGKGLLGIADSNRVVSDVAHSSVEGVETST
ncbi:ribosomal protein L4 domain-containing protein [Suillus subaureus]|uniref:Large ribosomal subunit protein uL4m n=1 Tax=Suillus subaureus TaxID=48587 RepID=A0A9P7EN47_9AGAM|nr:ribosomal protein L4 domain-containing protein [Suillus subaureus]KAG1825870.1 ribosomal protein L4 domain-containing protein [Suillus subaureus]